MDSKWTLCSSRRGGGACSLPSVGGAAQPRACVGQWYSGTFSDPYHSTCISYYTICTRIAVSSARRPVVRRAASSLFVLSSTLSAREPEPRAHGLITRGVMVGSF